MSSESELFKIESEELIIQISSFGAEIRSVIDKSSGFEFIWQADAQVWARSAPVLFPIVGRAKDDTILVDGDRFPMKQHGFARDTLFAMIEATDSSLSFQCAASDGSLTSYPFEFWLSITYRLFRRRLSVTYDVLNREPAKPLYYSLGAHPAFQLPVQDLSQYAVCFELPENLTRVYLTDGLLSEREESLGLNTSRLPLSSDLFTKEKDAVIIDSLNSRSHELVIAHDHEYRIYHKYDGFPYLGIWTKPDCHRFICLEPWCGIADCDAPLREFSTKPGVMKLLPGDLATHKLEISFFPPSVSHHG